MIHLHCHSYYSFLAGTLSIQRLLDLAEKHGCTALALTDVNNVSGAIEFYTAAQRRGVQPILGVELRALHEHAVLLASTWDAYDTICRLVTRVADVHPPARIRDEGDDEDALISVAGEKRKGYLLELLRTELTPDVVILARHRELLMDLAAFHPAEMLFAELVPEEEGRWTALCECAESHGFGIVAANDVYFGEPGGHELHKVLRSVATNTTLGTLDESRIARPSQYFLAESDFQQIFRYWPQALDARSVIADRCAITVDVTSTKFTTYNRCGIHERMMVLSRHAEEGFLQRYGNATRKHLERLRRELTIIESMGFVDYFLVAWDAVQYAIHKNHPYVGRGSGANSIVAYCLRITNVDPIQLDLYFERFLNPERRSPPDFDIDFSWRNRDDVINYLLSLYGTDRTAMIGTISTFNPRGAMREVGKVLGFSDAEIKQTVRMLPGYASTRDLNDPTSPFNRQADSIQRSPYGRRWAQIATQLLEFPNHYGIHSGGVILAPERLTRYTATQTSPKGVRITQQDMYSMEDWHLEKLDILSTRGLGTFEDTMRAVELRTGTAPPILDYKVACDDPETRRIMREGRTIGCFYVESPAMTQLLRKLRTDTFEMLTAASSIIRPGVAQSGMMQAFIERYHDPSKIRPPHPKMAELLGSTFGVMVYQEDVIKVAHYLGGLSLGQADLLRRAMSGKMRSRDAMHALETMFHEGCAAKGIEPDVAREIWRQMESFAGYSFCKAHSASYAVLSFQEAYLKAHHPALFLCSVLNNQGGYYRQDVYVQEAKRLGITVLLPSVAISEELNTCPDDLTIQLGFLHVKGLSARGSAAIVSARAADGPFLSFDDMAGRAALGFEDAAILIRCGACDCFGVNRPSLLARAKLLLGRSTRTGAPMLGLEQPLFEEELGMLRPYSPEQVSRIEIETFNFTVTQHVLSHYAKRLAGTVKSTHLREFIGRKVSVGGWMVAAKMSRTRKNERMMFVNLDDGEGMVDVVMFPKCFSRYGHLMHDAGPYRVSGVVAEEFGAVSVVADQVEALGAPENEAGAVQP